MKKISAFMSAAIVLALSAGTAQAQNNPQNRTEEKTIIIKKKSGPAMVVTSDSVSSIIINGEPLNPEDIASIRVMPRTIRGYNISGLLSNRSPRAFLGVATKDNDKGAEITEITKESPAQKAGLEKGDIITKVDKQQINNPQELSAAMKERKPGDKVEVTFLRGKKTKTVNATLTKTEGVYSLMGDSLMLNNFGPHSFNYRFTSPKVFINGFKRSPSIGLQIQDTEDESGVTVLKVEPDGAAEKAGVKPGDLITAINGKSVKDVNGVLDEMRAVENNQYSLTLNRDGKPMTIEVKIPKKLKKAEL